MNWYKQAQVSKKLIKNIEKKKQISLQKGWTQEEVNWAANITTKLNGPSYFQWLLEQARNGSANIQTGEDDKKIFEALQKFDELKNKQLISEDINKLKTFSDLYGVVSKFLQQQSQNRMQDIGSMEGADLLYDENNISIIKVTSPAAGKELFEDSGWCVNDPDTFSSYGPPFYLFRKYNNNYALYHSQYGDFKNVADKPMGMRETVPLLPAWNFLFETGVVQQEDLWKGDISVIPDIIQQKKTINKLCSIGDMQALDNVISSNLEYSNLIDKFNLTPEIFNLVKRNFLEARDQHTNAEEINDFYNSVPPYLDQAGILPTDMQKSQIEHNMGINMDRDTFGRLEEGTLDIRGSSIIDQLDNINSLYRKLHKSLKTDKAKRQAVYWNKKIIPDNPDAIRQWVFMPEELRRESLPEAQKGAAMQIRRNPEKYYSSEQRKGIPKELITEELQNASYKGFLYRIQKEPYTVWEKQDLPTEFRTDEFENVLDEARIRNNPTYHNLSAWNDIGEIFKTKELWNKFYLLMLDQVKNSYSDQIIEKIPEEFKTEELMAVFNKTFPSYSEQISEVMPLQPNLQEQGIQAKHVMNWYKKAQLGDRLGQCYVLSGRYVMDNQNAILVHGSINGRRFTGKDFDNPHAWVEEGNEVYDPVWDQRLPKEAYYGIMNAKSIKQYNYEEMAKLMLRNENWGPW